jgi:hypothetical protein
VRRISDAFGDSCFGSRVPVISSVWLSGGAGSGKSSGFLGKFHEFESCGVFYLMKPTATCKAGGINS